MNKKDLVEKARALNIPSDEAIEEYVTKGEALAAEMNRMLAIGAKAGWNHTNGLC
jgi:hypothetical protein